MEMYCLLYLAEEILKIKIFPHLCWDLNPRPPAREVSALTTILSRQVRLKGVKVCAQQSLSNYLPDGIFALNFANLEKSNKWFQTAGSTYKDLDIFEVFGNKFSRQVN